MENIEKKYPEHPELPNPSKDNRLNFPKEILGGLTTEEKEYILNGKIQKIFENIDTYLPL